MKGKKILLLFAAAVFLGILYFQVSYGQERSAYLFSVKKDEKITAVHLENEYGKLDFNSDGGNWKVEKDHAYAVNEDKMKLLLEALSAIKVSRKMKQENDQYGFDKFRAKISFTTNSGMTHSFLVGNTTMNGTDCYAKSLDTGEIVITDAASSAQLFGSLDAYRRKEILTVQADQIVSLEYRKGSRMISSLKAGSDETWNMVYPWQAPARKIEIGEFLSAMKDWNVFGYEYETPAKDLGLDDSGYSLTLKDNSGNEQVLRFGKNDGKKVAVQNGGPYDILYLYSDEVDLNVLDPQKLLFVAPLAISTDKIRKIDLLYGDSAISISVDAKNGTITSGGCFLDPTLFTRFYVSMMAITATGGKTESFDIPDTAEIRIRVTSTDGTVSEVGFSARDDKTYNMTINGVTQYYTDKDKLTRMTEQLRNCLTDPDSGS